MSLISRLGVVLGLDSAEFSAGLGKAETSLTKFGVASVAIGGMVQQLAEKILSTIPGALQFADSINDIAKANDLAVGTVLEFSQALSVSGGKAENAQKLISSFTNKIDEAAGGSQKTRDKFKELGVSLEDLGKLSEEDLLRKTIDGLAKITDPIHRNALAFDILGKTIKGTDIVGFNEQMQALKGTAEGSDKAISSVGDSFDRLDVLSRQMKIDLVNNIAAPFATATEFASDLYTIVKNFNQWIETKSNGFNLWDILLPMKGAAKADAKILEWFQAKRKALQDDANSGHYTPMAEGNYTPSLMTGLVPPKAQRETKESDEAEKRRKAAEKVRDAMLQQSLEFERQIKYTGEIQTNVSKLAIEFEKGGKYAGEQNTELGKRLMMDAEALDKAKAFEDYDKRRGEFMLKMYEQGQQIQDQVTQKKRDEQEAFDLATQEIEISTQRLEYEKTLAGLSDTQAQKALEFFDLRQKMIALEKNNVALTKDQIDKRQKDEQDRIAAEEANKRAQNTFQAGWNKAYNTWVEKAHDSAALAADAFNSMASSMESALDTFVSTGKFSFSSLAQSIIQDLIKIQLKAQMMSIFGGGSSGGGGIFDMFSGLFGGNGGVSATAGAYSIDNNPFIGMYADGGSPPVGVPSLVGERGAELFIPKTAGTIIPNNQLSSMMGNQPQVVYNGTVVQNMQAIDTQSATQFLAKNKQAVWSANMSAQRGMPQNR